MVGEPCWPPPPGRDLLQVTRTISSEGRDRLRDCEGRHPIVPGARVPQRLPNILVLRDDWRNNVIAPQELRQRDLKGCAGHLLALDENEPVLVGDDHVIRRLLFDAAEDGQPEECLVLAKVGGCEGFARAMLAHNR